MRACMCGLMYAREEPKGQSSECGCWKIAQRSGPHEFCFTSCRLLYHVPRKSSPRCVDHSEPRGLASVLCSFHGSPSSPGVRGSATARTTTTAVESLTGPAHSHSYSVSKPIEWSVQHQYLPTVASQFGIRCTSIVTGAVPSLGTGACCKTAGMEAAGGGVVEVRGRLDSKWGIEWVLEGPGRSACAVGRGGGKLVQPQHAAACRSMPQHKKFFRGTALAWAGACLPFVGEPSNLTEFAPSHPCPNRHKRPRSTNAGYHGAQYALCPSTCCSMC